MRRWSFPLILFSLFFLAWPSTSLGQKKTAWHNFVSVEGQFKAGTPVAMKQLENGTLGGNVGNTHKSYVYMALRPHITFTVRYTDYENISETPEYAQLKLMYDNARDYGLKAVEGTLISDNDITLGGIKGREIIIRTKVEIITNRMFLVNKRFYQAFVFLKISSENNKAAKAERKQFFDSFVITRTPPVVAQERKGEESNPGQAVNRIKVGKNDFYKFRLPKYSNRLRSDIYAGL